MIHCTDQNHRAVEKKKKKSTDHNVHLSYKRTNANTDIFPSTLQVFLQTSGFDVHGTNWGKFTMAHESCLRSEKLTVAHALQ